MKTKKFKVTFEIDAIPYNSSTFELIGPCFMEEYPEDIFIKEDIGRVLQMARVENIMSYMRMLDSESPDKECYKKQKERFDIILTNINNTIKFEAVD